MVLTVILIGVQIININNEKKLIKTLEYFGNCFLPLKPVTQYDVIA